MTAGRLDIPSAQTDLVFHDDFEILGTELVGDRKVFDVDSSVLPSEPFDWHINRFYWYNAQGSLGSPSGSWQWQIFTDLGDGAGLTWRVGAVARNIEGQFTGGVRRFLLATLDPNYFNYWSDYSVDGMIRYGLVCTVPPTLGTATLKAGIQADILFY